MEFLLILKILFIIGALITTYAVLRNLDIIKIILIYIKDTLLRKQLNNFSIKLFLDSKKNLGKQLTYANKKRCPVAIICGENEFKDNTITLKNLLGVKGENNQVTFPKDNLINEIKKFI